MQQNDLVNDPVSTSNEDVLGEDGKLLIRYKAYKEMTEGKNCEKEKEKKK